MSTRVSLRPERLEALAETTVAVHEALATRAGWLADAWDAYRAANAAEWRFDFGDLPGLMQAWGESLAALGAWAGEVAAAARDLDEDGGDVHRFGEPDLYRALDRDDRAVIDAHDDRTLTVDWGEPDDPPEWIEDLRGMAIVVPGGTHPGGSEVPAWRGEFEAMSDQVGDMGEVLDGTAVAFVSGRGASAAWRPGTPALLGVLASPRALGAASQVFTVGSAGIGGFGAAVDQWLGDSRSMNYSDTEMAARTGARFAGTATASALGSVGGGGLASFACGPGAPVCATVVVVGTGLLAAAGGDWLFDRLLPGPGPAEHDPDQVYDEIAGRAPGWRLADLSDGERDAFNALGEVSADVPSGLGERHEFYDTPTFEPAMAEEYDLPDAWVAERHGDLAALRARQARGDDLSPLDRAVLLLADGAEAVPAG